MILVGGENLIDFIQEPGDGGHPVYRAIPGGSPFNVAKAIARQGQTVGYLTPFSTDTLGQLLAGDLARDGVVFLSRGSPRPTSLAVVSLTDGQARYQFYREGTAERDVDAAALAAAVPEAARAFFIGSLAIAEGEDAAAWAALFDTLSGREVFTALDPNIRAAFIHDRPSYMARLERLIARADLIKLSDEDMGWLWPGADMHACAQEIFGRSAAHLVVLTKGDDGAFAVSDHGGIDVPPHPVPDLKDTVGAGDTFMGTLIAQIEREGFLSQGALASAPAGTVRQILETAARAAAINCGRAGCDPPTLGDLGAG